jgi:hypothetical protein
MPAPMTVKSIPVTMVIVAQPRTWIVAIARFEILVRTSWLSTRKALSRPRGFISIGARPGTRCVRDDPLSTVCVEIRTMFDPVVQTRSIFTWMQH